MRVAVAARNPDKPVLQDLAKTHGVRRYACDATEPAAVESLFEQVVRDLGSPTLVVHNIDGRVAGILRKGIAEADPGMVFDTLRNAAFSVFLVGQQAARQFSTKPPVRQHYSSTCTEVASTRTPSAASLPLTAAILPTRRSSGERPSSKRVRSV